MRKSRLIGAFCSALFSFITVSANAALIDNGGGLIYDNVLDITWGQSDASRTFDDTNTWADGLTLGGATDWRLPYISVAAGAGPFTGTPVDCNTATESACRDNELGYMFYQNLSGSLGSPILASGDPDLALFPSLQSLRYWSGTESNSGESWVFRFGGSSQSGSQYHDQQLSDFFSWAVHSGNVGAVPVPAAVWLFGSGLLGLIGIARRKKAA